MSNSLQWLHKLRRKKIVVDSLCFTLGLFIPLAFSPFSLHWLIFPVFSAYLLLCLKITPRRGFWRGYLFGLGQFCWGLAWLTNSFELYSNIPFFATLVLYVLLLSYLALYPALATFLAIWLSQKRNGLFLFCAFPFTWLLTDWARGIVLSGFPWLSVGHSQTDSWLVGYIPLIGSTGVGYVAILCSGLLVYLWKKPQRWKTTTIALISIWVAAIILNQIDWHNPNSKEIKVTALQGNINAGIKWKPEQLQSLRNWYSAQTRQNTDSQIVVWPETALPSFLHKETDFLNTLRKQVESHGTKVLLGLIVIDFKSQTYTNSAISLGGERYDKHHLVPIGEYFPFGDFPDWLKQYLFFPVSSIMSGAKTQPPLRIGDALISTSICFEIIFPEEVRKNLPEANLLVNISDDSIFKNTLEPFQNHQIARIRAIESARYLVRSVNTGITSIIDHKGNEIATTTLGKKAQVSAIVKLLTGHTPYTKFGDMLILLIALGFLLISLTVKKYRKVS